MSGNEIFTLLYDIIDRLERIEEKLDFEFEDLPEDIEETFDRVFEDAKKPKLSIVRTDNVVEFEKDD